MPGPGSYRIGKEEKEQVLDVLKSGYLLRYGSLDDPAYTFVATYSSVIFTGATPALAEIDENLNLDPGDIEKRITARTRAVTEKGLAIPDPVGLVGFDDIRIARYLPKALTTVHYPKFEMGRLGAEMLIRRIESGESRDPEHVVLDLKLIPRETA